MSAVWAIPTPTVTADPNDCADHGIRFIEEE